MVKQGQHIEKAPKDGEGRVLSLDLLTCELFQEHFRRRRAEAGALGVQVPEDAFAFSPDPVGREPWNPDTMTHGCVSFGGVGVGLAGGVRVAAACYVRVGR